MRPERTAPYGGNRAGTAFALGKAMDLNLTVGWSAILLGLVSGVALGLGFTGHDWLGGYASWRRRLLRLGHISFIGLGLLNIAFAVTCRTFEIEPPALAAYGFVVGAVTMPAVCLAAAIHEPLHRLFPLPVISLLLATGSLLQGVIR